MPSADRNQIKLYIYSTTKQFLGESGDEIKYQIIKQFLLANGEFDSREDEDVSVADPLYNQVLSLFDETEEKQYTDYENFEYDIVKTILMTPCFAYDIPSPPPPSDDRLIGAFVAEVAVINRPLSLKFSQLFYLLSRGTFIMAQVSMLAVFIYCLYSIRNGPGPLIRILSRFVIPSDLPMITTLINTIHNDYASVIQSQLSEIINWVIEKISLSLEYNPLTPILSYILPTATPILVEGAQEVIVENVRNQQPSNVAEQLVYWLRVWMS
jgi:hypothetical protein